MLFFRKVQRNVPTLVCMDMKQYDFAKNAELLIKRQGDEFIV